MWLLDQFMFFHSSQACRARWINDQFVLVNVPVVLCLLPLQAKLPPGSQESPESQKNALFRGFLDTPLMITSLWHAALYGWPQICLNQRAKNKTKNQDDSDWVTGHKYHHTSSDRLRNHRNNIWNTENPKYMYIFKKEPPLAEDDWATHECHEEVWRHSTVGVTHMWWFPWWALRNCGSPALCSLSTVRGLG